MRRTEKCGFVFEDQGQFFIIYEMWKRYSFLYFENLMTKKLQKKMTFRDNLVPTLEWISAH